MSHRLYIEQPPFAPWLGFCEALFACQTIALYDDVQFEDGGFQNRNKIKAPHGAQWLTVPVAKRNGQLIRDARIADSFDPHAMLRRLSLAYGRCPHADEAMNVLAPVLSAGHRWLLDLNLDLLTELATALGSPARLVLTSQLPVDRDADRTGRIVAICRAVGAGDLWAGTGTRGYLDPEDLRSAGITVAWNEYAARHPQYRQAWPRQGFTPALSVIDAVSSIGWAGTAVMLQAGLRAFQTAPEPEGIQP